MMLAFSDGDTYPTTASLEVLTRTDPPSFTLLVNPLTPTSEPVLTSVQASIAASDVASLVSHASSGGIDVPYGDGDLVFSYYVDGRAVYRRPRSIRLFIEGATVRIHITMGEAIPLTGPAPEVAPTATAELWGHLAVTCMVPDPAAGDYFVQDDPTWSTPGCASAESTYGLSVLRDLE